METKLEIKLKHTEQLAGNLSILKLKIKGDYIQIKELLIKIKKILGESK
jgi:hypothetical protein